jgi:hypothetical protein
MPFINGASSNFSDPLVVTEAGVSPAYHTLSLENLNVDSAGIVPGSQLMAFEPGL